MKKTIKLFSLLASIALSGLSMPALADTATPAAPTVTVNGMVDGYYTYNFTNSANNANGSGNTLGGNSMYFYNSVDNSYTLGLAEAKFTATQGSASAHLVLAYGQEEALGFSTAVSPNYQVPVIPGFDVLQAYVSYTTGQWTFNGGRFVTWMGNEVIESNSNWNYSHSLLFNFIPLWHTGISVNFAPSSSFGITGYVVDGNNTTVSTPAGKDYGLQALITLNSQWTITLNGEFGPDAGNATAPNYLTNVTGEGIFSFKPDSMWSFALDAQYGMTNQPSGSAVSSTSYWGLALYGRDQIASDFAIALRLEDVTDSGELGFGYLNGTSYVAGSVYEGTLTVEHNFTANLLGRVEGRYDTNSIANGVIGAPGTPSDTAAQMLYANGTATSEVTGTASIVLSY